MSSSGWQLWIRTLKFRNLNAQIENSNYEISRCEFRVATLNSTCWMPELGSWLWILNCEFGIWSGEFATPSVISRMEFRSLNSQISWRQKYKYHKRRAKTRSNDEREYIYLFFMRQFNCILFGLLILVFIPWISMVCMRGPFVKLQLFFEIDFCNFGSWISFWNCFFTSASFRTIFKRNTWSLCKTSTFL